MPPRRAEGVSATQKDMKDLVNAKHFGDFVGGANCVSLIRTLSMSCMMGDEKQLIFVEGGSIFIPT